MFQSPLACAVGDPGGQHHPGLVKSNLETLNLPLDWVRYGAIDTDSTPLDNGTHASCGTVVTGIAVMRAAADARDQFLEFAAERLGCTAALFWMRCWVGAEVEVDRETRKVQVVHLVVGADSGRSVNMIACRGQVEGAALQALGQSLFEELRYEDGKPVNATPLDYRVPLARDLPDQYESFVLGHGGPGPFGAKGIGEAGMLGVASAIANAIEDTVGVSVTQIPFTPERVLAAIEAAP
jgi:CO/xanthine dehydrogenase Mo-binding subunit